MKLYKGRYEINVINETDDLVDVFYTVKEFSKAFSELNTKDNTHNTNILIHQAFIFRRKGFKLNGKSYKIEFYDYFTGKEHTKNKKTTNKKLYNNEYEFYIIDDYGYVVDTFYNVKEFSEAYPELATKDKHKLNRIVSLFFMKKKEYFVVNGKKYSIEFQKYEENEGE